MCCQNNDYENCNDMHHYAQNTNVSEKQLKIDWLSIWSVGDEARQKKKEAHDDGEAEANA